MTSSDADRSSQRRLQDELNRTLEMLQTSQERGARLEAELLELRQQPDVATGLAAFERDLELCVVHACMHACVCMRVDARMPAHLRVRIPACLRDTHVPGTSATSSCTRHQATTNGRQTTYTCIHVSQLTSLLVHARTHARTCARARACITSCAHAHATTLHLAHTRMHVCMHACMHERTHVQVLAHVGRTHVCRCAWGRVHHALMHTRSSTRTCTYRTPQRAESLEAQLAQLQREVEELLEYDAARKLESEVAVAATKSECAASIETMHTELERLKGPRTHAHMHTCIRISECTCTCT